MDKFSDQPPIVIRRYRRIGHEEEGGAWKVAMADFALAMMALFIVLWIINSSNEQQREEISGYFQDPKAFEEGKKVPSKYIIDMGGSPTVQDDISESELEDPEHVMQAEDIEILADTLQQKRMEAEREQLQSRLDSNPNFSPFKNQLLVDITTEGVRLQLVEETDRPMFESGSAQLKYYTEDILWELAPILKNMGYRLSIAGHTDSVQMAGQRVEDDMNWQLSSLRADAARRALMEAGVPKAQIAAVIGKGDSEPLKVNDPQADENRRISITLLDEKTVPQETAPSEIRYLEEEPASPAEALPQLNDVMQELIDERERTDNSYDNPPNQDEAFW